MRVDGGMGEGGFIRILFRLSVTGRPACQSCAVTDAPGPRDIIHSNNISRAPFNLSERGSEPPPPPPPPHPHPRGGWSGERKEGRLINRPPHLHFHPRASLRPDGNSLCRSRILVHSFQQTEILPAPNSNTHPHFPRTRRPRRLAARGGGGGLGVWRKRSPGDPPSSPVALRARSDVCV